jgi:cytochrome b involved in lipid metabolism
LRESRRTRDRAKRAQGSLGAGPPGKKVRRRRDAAYATSKLFEHSVLCDKNIVFVMEKPPDGPIRAPMEMRARPLSVPSFPGAGSVQRASGNRSGRAKVVLRPGHSALDWANLRASGANLRGVESPNLARVTKEELGRHNSPDDAWTMLGGKVYNITPYVSFHPGGEKEILRCAGRDGTKLFQYTHAWVNYEHMLDRCLVGFYVG